MFRIVTVLFGILLILAAAGGILYWKHRQALEAEAHSEVLIRAFEQSTGLQVPFEVV